MRDVLVTFSLFLGANNGTLDGMPLGSIIDFENIMPCVAGALSSISSLYSMLYFLIYWNLTLIPTYVKATFLLTASMELFHRQKMSGHEHNLHLIIVLRLDGAMGTERAAPAPGGSSSISSLYSMLYFLIYWNLTLIPTYVKATFLLIASMELFHRQILLRA
jgi:hypothetical protein